MKKSIIAAGAASLAVAAMPVVGVFADNVTTNTDTIQVTVSPTCTFAGNNTQAHSIANASASVATDNIAWNDSTDTVSATMANGTVAENYGESTFTVTCNKHNGFKVGTSFTNAKSTTNGDLTGAIASNSEVVPLSATFSDNSNSGWSYKVTAVTGGLVNGTASGTPSTPQWQNASNAQVVYSETPVSAGTYTVQYGVGIDATQAADTYTGSIIYTITANATPSN